MTTIKSRGTVTIDVEHCKGCDLCIPACPPGVLAMSTAVNHMGFRYPELYPGCTGCAACFRALRSSWRLQFPRRTLRRSACGCRWRRCGRMIDEMAVRVKNNRNIPPKRCAAMPVLL